MNMVITSSNPPSKEGASLSNYLADLRNQIEKVLQELLAAPKSPYERLFEAAAYSLLGGGKRIRSILAIATAEAFDVPMSQSIVPACALELVHTYSLIHDDLPCMDDDDFRRGKPSLHKAYPEAHAILAGDFLLTYAFEILASAEHQSLQQKIDLVKLLAQGAGGHGMIAGQIMDIEAEGNPLSLENLQLMHRHKTGALITTAVMFGATIGNANKQQTDALQKFSEEIGLAFQIVDDILDVTENLKRKDSQYSSDLKNKKTTYTSLLGLEQAKQNAESLLISAKSHLETLPFCTERLHQLAELVVNRKT